jgi:ribonuclease P protein component
VVAKTVGNAVVRNRVRRQLRQLAAETISFHPNGMDIVVRVLPEAAHATPEQLHKAWSQAIEGDVWS